MVSMVMDVSGLISYPFPFCGMVLIAQAGKTYQRAFKQDHASSRLTNLNAESMPELPQHHSPFIFCRGYRPRISENTKPNCMMVVKSGYRRRAPANFIFHGLSRIKAVSFKLCHLLPPSLLSSANIETFQA